MAIEYAMGSWRSRWVSGDDEKRRVPTTENRSNVETHRSAEYTLGTNHDIVEQSHVVVSFRPLLACGLGSGTLL